MKVNWLYLFSAISIFALFGFSGCSETDNLEMHIDLSEVCSISMMDGNSGATANIADADDVKTICECLGKVDLEKGEPVSGDGWEFRLVLCDAEGTEISRVVLMGEKLEYEGYLYSCGEGSELADVVSDLFTNNSVKD